MNAGEKLKKLRLSKGLKQTQLAERLGLESASVVSKWENGRYEVPYEKMAPLSKALGVSIHELEKTLSIESDADPAKAWRDKIAKSNENENLKLLLMCLPIFEDGGIVAVTPEVFAKTINVDEARVRENWPKMMASDFVEVVGVPELGVLRLKY